MYRTSGCPAIRAPRLNVDGEYYRVKFPGGTKDVPKDRDDKGSGSSKKGKRDVVRYLCEAEPRADKEARNFDGQTPLHMTAENGRLDVVRYLCEAEPRADKEAIASDGKTALQVARTKGHHDVGEYLNR